MIEGRGAEPPPGDSFAKAAQPPWAINGLGGADATPSPATKEGVDNANLA